MLMTVVVVLVVLVAAVAMAVAVVATVEVVAMVVVEATAEVVDMGEEVMQEVEAAVDTMMVGTMVPLKVGKVDMVVMLVTQGVVVVDTTLLLATMAVTA